MSADIPNPPAFPIIHPPVEGVTCGGVEHYGLSMRDYFAMHLTQDELRELTYKHLSREAQEVLTGMRYPADVPQTCGVGKPAEYYIEVLKFNAAVNAAIRFISADAMLSARGGDK